jgi:outer membrane lipoprotein carrier protein
MKSFVKTSVVTSLLLVVAFGARADAVDSLREFSRDVKSARATFTQVVTAPDGKKQKTSSGTFELARPDRFRFAYVKPYAQLIVSDGQKLWIHDAELNQVTTRSAEQALGATPAALLAGSALDKDFELAALPDADGLAWVQAKPRAAADSTYRSIKIGFRAKQLAAVEILDSFGQRSRLDFSDLTTNTPVAPERFRFTPPAGADVIAQ